MGSWDVEIFVRSTNIEAIGRSLETIFEKDGYRLIERPSRKECKRRAEVRVYEDFCEEPLWGVAVRAWPTGWASLVCDPAYVLCGRAKGSQCPRLVDLAVGAGAEAFQYNVYDSVEDLILEAQPSGKFLISGAPYGTNDLVYEQQQLSNGGPIEIPFFESTILMDESGANLCKYELIGELAKFNSDISESPELAAPTIWSYLTGEEEARRLSRSFDERPFWANKHSKEFYFLRD